VKEKALANFFPEVGKEYIIELPLNDYQRYFFLKVDNGQKLKVTYESLTTGCEFYFSHYGFCKGFYRTQNTSYNCISNTNKIITDGSFDSSIRKVICSIDSQDQSRSSFSGMFQSYLPKTVCKLSFKFESN